MSLRILHTADNHIGISFAQYPDIVRDRLSEERFSALERLVAMANQRQAHFMVVAGDLFDKQTVTKGQIERAVRILATFEGENVLVLAGNHDYYEGADNKLWRWFRNACDGTCVLPLIEPTTKDFECDDCRVRFYACPCPSKHSKEHTIGWVADAEKAPEFIHVGIAHGNVAGLGLDADQQYFNMSEEDMRGSGVYTWLLGHIHAPAPALGTTGRPLFFMPGIHTPDSVKCSHPGYAWWIELGPDGSCRHEQLSCGGVRFVRLKRSLEHAADIESLRAACEALDAPNTVLDLQLTGRLKEDELTELNRMVSDMASRFLHLTREQDIAPVLDAAGIAKRFSEGTLPNMLLVGLLADEANVGDAHLALDIIETLHS